LRSLPSYVRHGVSKNALILKLSDPMMGLNLLNLDPDLTIARCLAWKHLYYWFIGIGQPPLPFERAVLFKFNLIYALYAWLYLNFGRNRRQKNASIR